MPLWHFLRGAWRRLPVETVTVCAAAASLIAAVHLGEGVWVTRVFLAALVATPLAFAAHGRGRAVELVAGAVAAAGAFGGLWLGLPDGASFERQRFLWPYGLTLLAALLVPFVAAAPRFTRFVRRFFEQVTTWGLLWGGAMLAIGVVFVAVGELFDWNVKRAAADTLLLVTAGFVLVLLDRLLQQDEGGKMPELWRRLATTIGAPFVSAMLVILVAYELWVLARGELPRNLLSPLIMAAGFVGFGCTLIIAAVTGEPVGAGRLAPAEPHLFTRRWSVRLTRAFPVVLLALLPMAAWALFQRVDQYGLTVFRVVRVASLSCLAVLSLLSALRWWRGRDPLTWQVPAVIALFAVGLAFTAPRLVIASQRERLDRLLTEAGVVGRQVAAEPPPTGVTVGAEAYASLQSALHELGDLGGEDALRGVLRGDVAVCAERWSGAAACLARLGVAFAGEARSFATGIAGSWVFREERVWPIELYAGATDASGLELTAAAVRVRAASASLSEAIAAAREGRPLGVSPIAVATPDGRVAGYLLLRRIDVDATGARRIEGVWFATTDE